MKLQPSQGGKEQTQDLCDVLVVDADPRTCETLRRGLDRTDITFRAARDVLQATLEMKRRPADLVVVNLQVNDNGGLNLLSQLRQAFPKTDAVALSKTPTPDVCLGAWRAGASDLLVAPMDAAAVRECLARVERSRRNRRQSVDRHQRLRSVCKQLNKARHEISQQVNLLCHDLVKAYQDLAHQLNTTQTSGEFARELGQEVEIEPLLRRTMEWILDRLGPVNAAVFLPDSEKNYTLGAYLNFDTNSDSVLMDVIGQTLVPLASQGNALLQIHTDQQSQDLFGQDAHLLLGRSWMACPAYFRNECLGVLVVFRGQDVPPEEAWAGIIESLCPVLAENIARAVRIYQRGLNTDSTEPHDDTQDEAGA